MQNEKDEIYRINNQISDHRDKCHFNTGLLSDLTTKDSLFTITATTQRASDSCVNRPHHTYCEGVSLLGAPTWVRLYLWNLMCWYAWWIGHCVCQLWRQRSCMPFLRSLFLTRCSLLLNDWYRCWEKYHHNHWKVCGELEWKDCITICGIKNWRESALFVVGITTGSSNEKR